MAYLVFARKYRPQTFEAVVEQTHVTRTLANALASGRLAHAILFAGPRGTGKTTIARILAKCVNCAEGPTATPCNQCRSCNEITGGNAIDVIEIDGASNNRVENIRELRENAKYMPAHSPRKIYIIDEVHMLSDAAFNALLKILEEPPAHVLFLFATTEVHKIPITILSRCQRHDLRRVGIDSIAGHMKTICRGEGIEIGDKGLAMIAREADGSIRDGLSLLDQIVTCSDKTVADDAIIDILGVIDRDVLFDVSAALFSGNLAAVLDICELLYRQGRHLVKFYTELIGHFRNLLVVKSRGTQSELPDIASHEIRQMAGQVEHVTQPYLYQLVTILFEEEWRIRQSVSPKTALEMTFFRMMQVKPAFSFDELIEKLENLRTGTPEAGNTTGENKANYQALRNRPKTPSGNAGDAPPHAPADPPDTQAAPDAQAATAQTREKRPTSAPEAAGNAPEHGQAGEPGDAKQPDGSDNPSGGAARIGQMSTEEILNRLRERICSKSPALGACISECRFHFEAPDRVSIGIDADNPRMNLLKSKKNLSALEKHCKDFFSRQVSVAIDVKESKPAAGAPKNRRQIEHEARTHPLVEAALKTFNAKIHDIKVS